MIKRDTPRENPERWPFITTEDATCDWICVPTPGDAQDALAASESLTGAAKLEEQTGAIIRAGWASTLYDLEGETGRDVYRELHRAGWKPARIVKLGEAVMQAFKAEHLTQDEVGEAGDFSESAPAGS